MNSQLVEGSLVLEKLEEKGRLGEFWRAIDSDDLTAVAKVMKKAGFDQDTIQQIINEIEDQ